MKHLPLISSFCSTPRRKLYMAIAAQMIFSAGAQAAPNGGTVVGGDGIIEQSGVDTTIIQNTDHLAIDWESFNIAAEERVQFIQPDADSVALNRILGNEASQIFGRLDANGHVILMNPNGVLFGEGASVNVGGLVATGLNINADDFMNGEFVLQAVDGTDGAVINKGIINAATGGNVALIGKQVDNQGLISAKLGSVTLAAGKEAVLTFDNQGLLGVRVSKEILQDEIGVDTAVANSGDITAEGGRVLLTGSVSQDIFSQAVNADGLNAKTSVVMHEDGSFTLGAGADVVNTGTISTSSETADAGQIVVLGENVNSSGAILANSKTASTAGNIEVHSRDTTLLTEDSTTSATNNGAGSGGQIKILGDRVGILDQSQINTSGTIGGGDINIGGGFQGKETQLRNAARTVVGKDTLIEANATSEGDGGDVIVWADETTSFTGEINVRGGELGGDGGFVEVSGKENLRFLGEVDRTAVRGENGTLLLDPENITIVTGDNGDPSADEALVSDSALLFEDTIPPDSTISANALRNALLGGNTQLEALGNVLFETGIVIDVLVEDPANIASLIINAGGDIQMQHDSYLNLGGDVVFNAGVAECGGAPCAQTGAGAILISVGAFEGTPPFGFGDPEGGISANGEIIFRAADRIQLLGDLIASSTRLHSGGAIQLSTLSGNTTRITTTDGNLEIHAGDSSILSEETKILPLDNREVVLSGLRAYSGIDNPTINFNGTTQTIQIQINGGDLIVSALDAIAGYNPEVAIVDGNITMDSIAGDISFYSATLNLENVNEPGTLPEITLSAAGNIESTLGNNAGANITLIADTDLDGSGTISISENFNTAGGSFSVNAESFVFGGGVVINTTDPTGVAVGNIDLTSQQDIVLPTIVSGGDLNVESILGDISSFSALEIAGNTTLSAAGNIELSEGFSLNSDFGDLVLSSDSVVSIRSLVADQPIQINVGGDITIDAGASIDLVRGVYNVGNFSVNSTDGSLFASLVELNSGGRVDINLEKGVVGSGSDMLVNAGSFSASATNLGMESFELNVDSSIGSGEVTLTATRPDASIVSYGEIWLPQINPSGNFNTTNVTINAQTENAGIYAQRLPDGAPRFNVGGSVTINSLGDVELPEINIESAGGSATNSLTVSTPGKIIQQYDIYTGGADYTASASEFVFDNGVQINTDFSSANEDSVVGTGNISISSMSDIQLPDLQTQSDCQSAIGCGALTIEKHEQSAGIAVENAINAAWTIHGPTHFNLGDSGELYLNSHLISFKSAISMESAQGTGVFLGNNEGFSVGDWNVSGSAFFSSAGGDIIVDGALSIGSSASFNTLDNPPGQLGGTVALNNPQNKIGMGLEISGGRAVVYHDGDLNLYGIALVGPNDMAESAVSRFVITGNLTQSESISGGLNSEGGRDSSTPIVFDVSGDLNLSSVNRISAIEIINAQDASIYNLRALTLNGINANNLLLSVEDGLAQTGAITVEGQTTINAAVGANIDLLDPLNDFNSLSVQAAGPAIVNIADSNNISLADIDLNGASQGGALSVTAAAITQEENGRILLQDGTRLNLQADYITLGANGSATVDIYGSTLNGVFTRDLNIQGAVRGGEGVAGTGVAGFYFNGSVEDNFFEVAEGASIVGDFISGSKIHLGDGNDRASLAGDVAIPVEGGAGQDTFLMAAPNLSIAQILGNEDQDILVGPDANNVWVVTENGEGGLSHELAVSSFGGIETIRGGSQTDDFIVGSLTAALQIDGGGGLDSLSANLTDLSTNNQWIVDGVNSGSLNEFLLFTSIENLIGNNGADTVTFLEGAQIGDVSTGLGDDIFTLAADVTTGLLDAGEGQDTLNLNGLNAIYTYFNELIGGDGSYTTAGFETENNEGGSKTIVGVDGYDAEWIIGSDGSVTVNALQGVTTETNRFTGVTRVEGASGNDTFILQGGYLSDRIVGGQGGNDSLIADTTLANNWLLDGQNSGTVQVVEADREQVFEAITNLVGGNDNDTFNILSGANFDGAISGGAGTNSLVVLDPTATSVWTVASTNDLRVESSANVASQIAFSDIQSLIGNDNEDVLDLSTMAGSVDLEQMSAGDFTIQGFDAFISNGGDFVGANSDSAWVLNDISEVSYTDQNDIARRIRFTGFQNVYGGTGEDYFRIDDLWFAGAGAIYAGTQSEALDTAELNMVGGSAWSFKSSDNTAVYTNIVDPESLFSASRIDALNSLDDSLNDVFYLIGIERNLGGDGDDVFFVYGDSDLYSPNIDGRGGDDYLLAFNWGTPQDLIWNIAEDFGGNINDAVVFKNFENLKSHDFIETRPDEHVSHFNVAEGVSIDTLVGDASNTTFNIGSGASVGSILDNGGIDTINVSDGTNTWRLAESGGSLNSTTFAEIEVLNGGSGFDEFIIASLTTQVTQIDGSGGSNSLTAFDQANNWSLRTAASTLNGSLQFDNITQLIGNAGVDAFLVLGDELSLNIDGGGGVDELLGSNQLNSWLVDGAYAGTLNDSLTFTSVEHLQGGALVDDFTVTAGSSIGQIAGGDGDDIISLGTGASAIYILGEAGSDRMVLGDLVDITGYLDGGEGDVDVLDISAFTGALEFDFTMEATNTGFSYTNFEQEILPASGTSFFGGDGDTRWTFAEDNSFLIEKLDENGEVIKSGTYASYNSVRGGSGDNAFVMSEAANFNGAIRGDSSGTNTLTAAGLINNWIIEGQNQGRLQADGDAAVTLFSNISDLVGGTNSDIFEIAGGSITGSIDGGAGSDRLVITDATAINDWLLAAQNSVGVVAQFRGIEALVGNANTDSFTFTGQTDVTSIEGGDGENTLSWSAGNVAVNLGTQSINNAIAFSEITTFAADQENDNSLTGADQANAWILNSADSGTINSIAFSGFNHLQGGSGEDSLQATDADNRWLDSENPGIHTLNDTLTFTGIESLIGGAGDDSFSTLLTGVVRVDGGLGINTIAAFSDASLEWQINTAEGAVVADDGSLDLSFANIQILDAAATAGISTFVVNDLDTIVTDISGTALAGNILDFSNIAGALRFDVQAMPFNIRDVDTFIGNGAQSSVVSGAGDNLWIASGERVDLWAGGRFDDTTPLTAPEFMFRNFSHFEGGLGVDDVVVDSPTSQLTFIGAGGENNLFVNSSADSLWNIAGTNSGTLDNTVAFENIQNLYGNAGNDTFTFSANSSIESINAGAGDDTFILANNITAALLDGGDGLDILDRGGLNSIVTYLREVIGGDAVYTTANIETETSAGGSTTVVAVDGYDARWLINGDGSVSVTAVDASGVSQTNDFTDVTRLQGGSGADEFVLLTSGVIVDGIAGSGDDSLQASDTTNTWIIDAANAGELAVQEDGTALLFQGIATLVGGSGADLFNIVAGGSISGSIDGGAGADRLAISDESLTNNWQLGLQNSVNSVAQFRAIETLEGNGGDDLFAFTAVTDVTSIEGNAGNNSLLWSAGDLAVNLGTGLLNDQIRFVGINTLEADATATNTLVGADENNSWTLNGPVAGTVANANGSTAFSGFQSLVGGALADAFVLTAEAAGFSGINGEGGADTLTAADQLNQWVLDAEGGELNGLRFANVEALNGGALQDNFVLVDASSQAQTLDGGAGANRLTGYDQVNTWNVTNDNAGDVTGLSSFRNIQTLIGGTQADTFTLAAGVNLSEIYAGAGNDAFVIGAGVAADNFYGEEGDDSVEVEVGLVLSGVLDGGSGGETEGDYIDLSNYTLLDATADLGSVLGFTFLNFERIDEPNNQGVYFGGNGTNFWYITGANEGRLEIRDGEDAGVYEFSGVHSLLGGEGEDVFIFANDAAAVSTLIDGGNGTAANTLDLSAQGLINQWLLDGTNSGLVSNDSNTSGNVFTNIAYLIGGSNRDIFELQAGGSIAGAIDGGLGADELFVAVEQTSNWQLGGAGGHSVTGVASFTNVEVLTGSAGADNFDILAELTDVSHLNGGAGSDAVNFLYEAPVSVELARGLAGGLRVEAIERFTAADARSILIGVDAASNWSIDGADRGSVRYVIETEGDAINVAFDGFGNLMGGAGDDRFVISQGGAVSGTLSGGDGRNTVDLQELTDDIHVAAAPSVVIADGLDQLTLADVDQLIGNGRTWLYGASDRSYTWTIDGVRSGQMTSTLVDDGNRLLAFENLSAIRGGTHDDIFRVVAASPLVSLDGGAAETADLVDYSQVNGNLRINLADALAGQNGVITGVEGIRGNNAGPDSLHIAELIGPETGATWSIGDLDADGLSDGINDGEVTFGEQTITFIDFNQLTGGAGADTFNQIDGVVLGTLNGGAGNDIFNIEVTGANAGTGIIGGAGSDSLVLRGGDPAGLMTYTAAADGGEFDYSLAEVHYKVGHQGVENVRDGTLAASLEIRGSSAPETFSLANNRFQVNGGDVIEYGSKRDIAVRSGINDIIEIADNLVVENTLTLANGTVIANDPANNSVTATGLILDSVWDVGLSSARLRTSVDDLFVRNSAGDIYLQEQNGLNLAEFNTNGVFDLLLLNGNLTNSAPLMAADVFRVIANNGDITLTGANQLRDDVAVTGNRVELHNASTLTLIEVNAEDLYLRTQRGIEGDGPLTVAGLTDIDAQGDVLLDFATNDFNRVRVTNAVNLTLVDQNAIELLDINASGTVVVRSTNTITLNDTVTGANGVEVSSDTGSINQNGNISTGSGPVVVSAGNGEVNLGEDARIVSNGGSVSISAGAGNVNMGGDTRIAANGGDVNIVAADSVVVAEVVSSGNVNINAGSGSVSDGNGGATNVSAGGLQSSSNTGFGDEDALETNVGNIDITTNTGNVAVSNSGNVTVDNVSTGQGDISLVNEGDVELGGGSIVAENGANGGSVNIDVSQGSVSQSGSTDIPAVKGGGAVVINAPDGAIGEGGGLRVDAPFVEIIAAIKAGDIFVNPGADKIEYFSGSFKFDDQLLAVEPLEDINPAIFANVKSYFFNDISLLLPRDQLYDEDEEE